MVHTPSSEAELGAGHALVTVDPAGTSRIANHGGAPVALRGVDSQHHRVEIVTTAGVELSSAEVGAGVTAFEAHRLAPGAYVAHVSTIDGGPRRPQLELGALAGVQLYRTDPRARSALGDPTTPSSIVAPGPALGVQLAWWIWPGLGVEAEARLVAGGWAGKVRPRPARHARRRRRLRTWLELRGDLQPSLAGGRADVLGLHAGVLRRF